ARPGEHDEVRGQSDAHVVQHLLRRGERRRQLAGRRRRAAGAHPRRAARVACAWSLAAASAAPHDRWRAGVSAIVRVLLGVWEFFVGDDWLTALGVAVALGLTALLAGAGVAAWWVLPAAVLGLLALSLRRAAR